MTKDEPLKTVKFKVDEGSDSDGFSDDDMSYSSSDSDSSDLEVTGGYYTKEMFLKKCVHCIFVVSLIMLSFMSSLPLLCPLSYHLCCVPCYALFCVINCPYCVHP